MICNFGITHALQAYRWADYSDNGNIVMDPEHVAWNFSTEMDLSVNQYMEMDALLEEYAVDGNVTFNDFWWAQPWSDEVCGWY